MLEISHIYTNMYLPDAFFQKFYCKIKFVFLRMIPHVSFTSLFIVINWFISQSVGNRVEDFSISFRLCAMTRWCNGTPDTFPSVSWHAHIGNQHNSVCRVTWRVIFVSTLPQSDVITIAWMFDWIKNCFCYYATQGMCKVTIPRIFPREITLFPIVQIYCISTIYYNLDKN